MIIYVCKMNLKHVWFTDIEIGLKLECLGAISCQLSYFGKYGLSVVDLSYYISEVVTNCVLFDC
jgi:hypothetical protein